MVNVLNLVAQIISTTFGERSEHAKREPEAPSPSIPAFLDATENREWHRLAIALTEAGKKSATIGTAS